jgi:F-type H+-transporting ATPase subunit epsilon
MVFEGDADMVIVQGSSGEMGILPNHAPLLSTLGYGVLKVRHAAGESVFTVAGGVVEVQPYIVTILADAAENVEEIDISRAEAAKRRAEDMLKQGPPPGSDAYDAIEAALRRSRLRLDAAQRFRRSQHTPLPGGSNLENQ